MYFGAIDQGTTSTRFILFSEKGEIAASAQKEHKQHFPKPGWVEHDPEEIWKNTSDVIKETIRKADIKPSEIKGIGITNQRETVIAWNRETGKPYYNAIVWQDLRGTDLINSIKEKGLEKEIQETTGLILNPYFSASKIVWLLDNIPGLREDAENGKAVFGTIDSYLVWKLTGGKIFIADVTNASRYLLMNLRTLKWDEKMLSLFGIPEKALPEIVPSAGRIYGYTETDGPFDAAVAIAGILGDQQAALFGQACFKPGTGKCTYGTGCFLLMNTGEKPVFSKNGLVTTIAWGLDGKVEYALEGSIFVAGAAIQWLRDEMRLIDSAPDSEYMAKKVKDTNGCYVVPAFTGLGAPYWDQYARGTIVGITRGVNKYHIIRATLESLAYQVNDVLEAMKADSGIDLAALKVDGGASANDFLMQTQADIINAPVNRPQCVETTAMGAAYLAGLAVGYWSGKEDVIKNWAIDRTFEPALSDEDREAKVKGWKKAVKYAYGWAKED